MTTITIPKKLARQGDLVVIPRKEYEDLLKNRRAGVSEFIPTAAERKALIRAEKNFSAGKTLSYNELVRKLGFGN